MMRWLALLSVLFIPVSAQAEQARKFGNVEVHYNAMLASDLLPEVAKVYNIARSKTRGIITISVLKKNAVGVMQPTSAKLTAYLVNINNQLGNIEMREIKDGGSVYYLGEFRVSPPDTLKFNVAVELPGVPKREVGFSKKFYK